MKLEQMRWLSHVVGVANGYLAVDNIDKGGWWLLLALFNVVSLLTLAHSAAKVDEAIKKSRG